MAEQVLDVRGSTRLVRRSWRLVAAVTLAGVLAAGAYEYLTVPPYRASALVLLPASPPTTGASIAHPVTTDARIATSGAVLEPAGHAVDPSLSLSQLQARVSAAPAATGVLKISATGTTRRQAESLANAVAAQLVTFLTTSSASATSSVVAALDVQDKQLEGQLAAVQEEAAAVTQRITSEGRSSVAGQQDSALLARLTSEETALGLQITTVKSQISSGELGQVSANQGTQVLQRAAGATPPSVGSLAVPLVIGLVAGALVGSLIVLARQRRHPKVWTRDGLAEALGAPVVLSLGVQARHSPGSWIDLLEHHQPDLLEQWSVRKALRELGAVGGERRSLVVLVFEDDAAAAAQIAQVAVTAASSGLPTALSVVSANRTGAVPLRAVCARFAREDRTPRDDLTLYDGPPPEDAPLGELFVTMVAVDDENPSDSLVSPRPAGTTVTVAAVSTGFASAGKLARLGVAAADGDSPVKAVFVANPDPGDETVGRFAVVGSATSVVEHRRAPRQGRGMAMERSR